MKINSDEYIQPEALAALDWWVPSARNAAGVKLPRAPYQNGGSYPAEWSKDLPEEKRPERDLQTVETWAGYSTTELRARNAELPADATDETLNVGLILPVERLAPEIRPTLIDWDDIRRPETGEIHPAAAEYLEDFDGYVSISQSGTGVHQWVFGEIPGNRKKFVQKIDSEPFVHTGESGHADDIPQVEIYDGGRHVIMTGRHGKNFGTDLSPGKELLTQITKQFSAATTAADRDGNEGSDGGPAAVTRYGPPGRDDDSGRTVTAAKDSFNASDYNHSHNIHENGSEIPLCYQNALIARRDGTAFTNGHDTNLLASNLGINLGYSVEQVVDHFSHYSGGAGTDFDRQITRGAVETTEERAKAGDLNPPGTARLIEAGILPPEGCEPDCPIHGRRGPLEHVPILPEVDTTDSDSWGSLEPERADREQGLNQTEARARTAAAIESAFERRTNALIDALPTLGKSFGAIRAAAETETKTTVFTNRGRKEQYQQYREWGEERGLSVKVLPSVWRTCGCFKGDHGQAVADLVQRWYRKGATGKEIHILYESAVGEPIPCDGPAGDRCGFKSAWQADFGEYDVLLGSYVHSYVSSAVNGRTCVIDEYPRSAFETTIGGERLPRALSAFLEDRPQIPYNDMADVLENRSDSSKREDALSYLESIGVESDGEQAISKDDGHADSRSALWVLLAAVDERGEQYANGWERAHLPHTDGDIALYNRSDGTVHILRKPNLAFARNVVCLDGTPAPRLWETVQHKKLSHTRILNDTERAEYLRKSLGMTFVQTTDGMKPYNSADHVYPAGDGALLEAVTEQHGRTPALITTQTAEAEHESAGLYQRDGDGGLEDGNGLIRAVAHYGDLKGSNRFKSERLGCVIGSNHFGDSEVQKMAAFVGADVSRVPLSKGVDLSYTEADGTHESLDGIGNAIYRDMTDGETLQAALRFGRDGNGATVYLHTAAVPTLLESAGPPLLLQGRIIQTYSTAKRAVLETLGELIDGDGATTARRVESETELPLRSVQRILKELSDDGFLETEALGGNRGNVWFDPAGTLSSGPTFGQADLPEPVERDSSLTGEVGGRYRWNFRLRREGLNVPGEPTANVVVRSD